MTEKQQKRVDAFGRRARVILVVDLLDAVTIYWSRPRDGAAMGTLIDADGRTIYTRKERP